MGIAELAAVAVATAMPFLGQVANGAAEKLGQKAVETSGQVAGWIRLRARGETAVALAELEAKSGDTEVQARLEAALVQQLEASPEEVAELQTILQVGPVINVDNREGLFNTGAMTGVVIGSNNSIRIGK
ncbi:hypothetical protein [Phenylobacterium sp.]|uniref:hypothetical protein n=1 Tax=Phenylobacterium sp. TaxID=1871053 RepID=UPI0025ED72D8|nr:hypothetical protein [Phenylobacterium sp.]MBX3484704.1 hypothetical protein [Phenylobacterium sp.]MCW5759715.1 hypothetical protein [Phenylobacterium sp.]